MLFPKLKSYSKRFENILKYSLSDSKNFLFLVISSVCLYFLTKKNPERIRANFVIRAPFYKDQSEKLISEPDLLKVQTFISPVKIVSGH